MSLNKALQSKDRNKNNSKTKLHQIKFYFHDGGNNLHRRAEYLPLFQYYCDTPIMEGNIFGTFSI